METLIKQNDKLWFLTSWIASIFSSLCSMRYHTAGHNQARHFLHTGKSVITKEGGLKLHKLYFLQTVAGLLLNNVAFIP